MKEGKTWAIMRQIAFIGGFKLETERGIASRSASLEGAERDRTTDRRGPARHACGAADCFAVPTDLRRWR